MHNTTTPPTTAPRSAGAGRSRPSLGIIAMALLATACAGRGMVVPEADEVVTEANFVLNDAIQVAGNQVPQGVDSFYFLVIDEQLESTEAVAELLRLLRLAKAEDDFLGVVGPSAERNLAVMQAALARTDDGELRGLQLIYLGPKQQVDQLQEPVASSGAGLHFMVYPPEDSETAQPRRIRR